MRIFLTGRPGCGKSTLIQRIIDELQKRKIKIAGILTPEIRTSSGRQGFKIIDIASGEKGILAAVYIKSNYKVSKYGINISDIDRIVEQFEKSLAGADIIIIDEVGKMEFYSKKFKATIDKILALDKPLLASLHRALINDFKNYGEIIFVDKSNKEQLVGEVLEKLTKAL